MDCSTGCSTTMQSWWTAADTWPRQSMQQQVLVQAQACNSPARDLHGYLGFRVLVVDTNCATCEAHSA